MSAGPDGKDIIQHACEIQVCQSHFMESISGTAAFTNCQGKLGLAKALGSLLLDWLRASWPNSHLSFDYVTPSLRQACCDNGSYLRPASVLVYGRHDCLRDQINRAGKAQGHKTLLLLWCGTRS